MVRTLDSVGAPDGLLYRPNFLSNEEEAEFLALAPSMPFRSILMRGQVALRTVACFGFDYVYSRRDVASAAPFPPLLLRLRQPAEALAGDGSLLEQAIVTNYPAGAGINWHIDAPVFGPSIVGVSVGDSARLHLRQASNVHRLIIESRSAYVLSGEARSEWRIDCRPFKRSAIQSRFAVWLFLWHSEKVWRRGARRAPSPLSARAPGRFIAHERNSALSPPRRMPNHRSGRRSRCDAFRGPREDRGPREGSLPLLAAGQHLR